MYIPTIFFNSAYGCVQPIISGSGSDITKSNGYWLGQFTSGSQTYFYIDIAANTTASIQIAQGVTSTAKLLLIGGGGYSNLFQKNPSGPGSRSGGGAAGNVYYQDISLEPGTYILKAGRGGYSSAGSTEDGTESSFERVNSSLNPIVAGGGQGFQSVGGNNSIYFGVSGSGYGGAGAGSAGDAATVNGGAYTTITGLVDYLWNYSNTGNVAGGGGGILFNGTGGTTPAPDAWGTGGSGGNSADDGNNGRAVLFIPIGNCQQQPTGSLNLPTTESFQAEGGDLTGTFTSGSVKYKYHLFYNTGSIIYPNKSTTSNQYFRVQNGYTQQAKILLVGGGAGGRDNAYDVNGGAGAGKVAITRNIPLYGIYGISVGGGGTAGTDAQSGGETNFISLSNYTDYYAANGGGPGADIVGGYTAGTDGGSGGGGSKYFSGTWQSLAKGLAINPSSPPVYATDEYYGNNGGAGTQDGSGKGGGGGGATSVGADSGAGGSGYTLTDEFFPSSTLFVSASIAKGGDRGALNTHTTQPYSGDGGQPGNIGRGGFLCITYPISGSTANSPA